MSDNSSWGSLEHEDLTPMGQPGTRALATLVQIRKMAVGERERLLFLTTYARMYFCHVCIFAAYVFLGHILRMYF